MKLNILMKSALLSSVAGLSFLPTGSVAFGQAAAQASAGAQLEEVVVTARRREEVIQKTPVAITAFSAADLTNKAIQGLNDLQTLTPSLTSNKNNTNSMGMEISLRGQTETRTSANSSGTVGVYVDDVYDQGAEISGSLINLVDLERVEVLKGPQGTLYGRNTTGGAIKFVTKKPTDDFEGYLTLGLGNYDRHYVEGMVNVPIVEGKAAARIVGVFDEHSGYSYDVLNKRDLDDLHKWAVRGTLKLDPTDDLDIVVAGNVGVGRNNGTDNRTTYLQPGISTAAEDIAVALNLVPLSTLSPLFLGGSAAAKAAATAAITAALPAVNAAVQQALNAPRDQAREHPLYLTGQKAQTEGGSVTLTYDWDPVTIKSVTAMVRSDRKSLYNAGGGYWTPLFGNQQATNQQISQELQVSGVGLDNDRLKYSAGIYYFHTNVTEFRNSAASFPLFLGPQGLGVTGPNQNHNAIVDQSLAAYGQATLALTDSVNFTGGVRWTTESEDNLVNGIVYSGLISGSKATCGAPFPATAATPASQCFVPLTSSSRNVSYTAGLDWSVTDAMLLYAKTSRGYRAGGANQYPAPGTPVTPYGPEIVADYEGGIKSQWFDNRFRLNADIYHSDYTNIQRGGSQAVPNGQGGTIIVTETINAAAATIDGAELEAELIPAKGLKLGATVAYTYPKYLKYTQANLAYPGGVEDLSGEPFYYVSRWTYTLTAGYEFDTDFANIHTELDWSYRTKASLYAHDLYPATPTGPSAPIGSTTQPGFGLLDASVSLDMPQYSSTLTLWGKNMLDKRYFASFNSLVNNGVGTGVGNFGDPATFGVDYTYHFGGASATTEKAASTYTPPPAQAPMMAAPKSYLVFFDFNKSDLTSDAVKIVDTAAKNAGPAKVTQIEVTGHTDTVGSDAYNMRLSRRRAESVAAQLEKDGVPSSEIAIFAKGKRDLLVPTGDGVKEPQNRRVQIVYAGGANS